jgi:hypothetical protein
MISSCSSVTDSHLQVRELESLYRTRAGNRWSRAASEVAGKDGAPPPNSVTHMGLSTGRGRNRKSDRADGSERDEVGRSASTDNQIGVCRLTSRPIKTQYFDHYIPTYDTTMIVPKLVKVLTGIL